jgi:uncharacterized protein YjbI with pentapeptide repeats
MFPSSLIFLILSLIVPGCSSAGLRGKSATGTSTNGNSTDQTAGQGTPLPALHNCQASDPIRLCGLSSLAPELLTVDDLSNAQTLYGIRLTSQNKTEQSIQDITLNASCLSENSFVNGQWDRSVFQGSEMILTEASRTSWRQARFVDSDLRLSHFAYANFSELTVQNSCLASSNWSASRFQDVSIENSSADQGNFSGITAQGRFEFVRGRLAASNFSHAVFEGPVSFQDSDMRGVNLSAVTFKDTVNWQGAQLSGATWMDGRICAEGSVGQCKIQ